ncbi:hypothetical protein EGY25_09140 [Brevundimonas intermedia]|uniref:Uncharacterized protein n=1 Tax=Brevundimonas intermedia TaxID=74315 RepID=A0A4Y9RSD7_9CAUL|nr:hypothetical protein [Brevundimonas intermedia]TFW12197.1 hypothetical protein EGY25_09140 [Brevundimonas intermedia]
MSESFELEPRDLRHMVQDHWRSLIRLAGVSPQMAGEEVFRFEALIEQMAARYPPSAAMNFRDTLKAFRAEYAERELTDPDGLRQSLQITGGASGAATAWLANLETPASVDLRDQQDAFFRDLLTKGIPDPKRFQLRWEQFIAHLQSQINHLPKAEQDGIMTRVVLRNAEYMALAKSNREALKARLGVDSFSSGSAPIADMVVETTVRATIWQGIGALLRGVR